MGASNSRSAVNIVADGTLRRQVYGLYAGGAEVRDIVEETGLRQDQVADLLQIVGYDRGRASKACRDWDAVHGPPRRAGRMEVAAVRAAVRAELEPLSADLRKAVTAVTTNRPVPQPPAAGPDVGEILPTLRAVAAAVDQLAATPAPVTSDRDGEILAAVRAVQEAVQTLADRPPAPDRYPAAPGGVVACYGRYWCPGCGSRYVDDGEHECGPLVPVTVTITVAVDVDSPAPGGPPPRCPIPTRCQGAGHDGP
ncbi:hypothetical protein ACN27G_06125 [Plantactinospora sp. WMMB334]|uniref:hypothetical protein n=1 Tax=Plantactinospora sp. WMMB334 TaxID=3404119 RepID=UPI003B930C03